MLPKLDLIETRNTYGTMGKSFSKFLVTVALLEAFFFFLEILLVKNNLDKFHKTIFHIYHIQLWDPLGYSCIFHILN